MASASSRAKPVRVSNTPATTRMPEPTKLTAGRRPRAASSTNAPTGRLVVLGPSAKALLRMLLSKLSSVMASPRIRSLSETVLASGKTIHRIM